MSLLNPEQLFKQKIGEKNQMPEPQLQPPPQDPPPPPQDPPDPQKQSTQLFQSGYNEGVKVEKSRVEKTFNEKLSNIFGTSDFEAITTNVNELRQIAEKGKKPEPSPELTKRLEILERENAKLTSDFENKNKEIESANISSLISNAVNRQNPITPAAAESITNHIKNNFIVKNDGIFKAGSDIPEFTAKGEKANIDDLIGNLKTNDWNFAFSKTTNMNHINAGNNISTSYKLKRGDLQKEGFKAALEKSGQLDKALNGEAIDFVIIGKDPRDFGIQL